MRGVSKIFAVTSLAKAWPLLTLRSGLHLACVKRFRRWFKLERRFAPTKSLPVISRSFLKLMATLTCANWEVLAADAFKANWEQKEERWTVSQPLFYHRCQRPPPRTPPAPRKRIVSSQIRALRMKYLSNKIHLGGGWGGWGARCSDRLRKIFGFTRFRCTILIWRLLFRGGGSFCAIIYT